MTAKIELVSDEQLKMSGCLAGKALCRADLGTRTTAPARPLALGPFGDFMLPTRGVHIVWTTSA